MSTSSPQLDETDRELLVAYLDGELSPEDAGVVESRLAGDESFRRELQELQRAWDVLGELPRPMADEEFTRTTLEMVAVAAQEDVEAATVALPAQRRRYTARLLGVVLVALLAGVLCSRLVWPDRNGELLSNLPIIENIDAYRHLGDMAFLQRLHEQHGDALESISPLGEEDVDGAWKDWRAVSQEDEAGRRERITVLEPAAAGRLQAKWRQYEALTDSAKARLRTLHESLIESDQSEELHATVARFAELLSRRSSGDKVDLRTQSDMEQRLEVVQSWLRRERPRRHRDLTYDDRVTLSKFRGSLFQRRRDRDGPPTEAEREAFQRDLDTLVMSLSQEAQQDLKQEGGGTDYRELMQWVWEATPSRNQMPEELEDFYVSIEDNDDKARLLLLPYPEMRRELSERYLRPFEDGRWRDRDRRGFGGPGGRDGRGRGDGPDRRRGERDGRGDGRDNDSSRGDPGDD